MSYPTAKEKELFSTALVQATRITSVIKEAIRGHWEIDATELLEFTMQEADKLNDAILELVTGQVAEEEVSK